MARRFRKDTGYAWVVMFAAFYPQLISIGIAFSYAIFFDPLKSHFGASEVDISWLGSFNQTCLFLFSPLAGYLVEKFDRRVPVIISGVLCTLGYLLSYFCTQLWHMYITYGGMVGLGFSMMFLPSASAPVFWFDKYRSVAVTFVSSANGLGTFLNGLLVGELLDSGVSWRVCMLVQCGLSAGVIVAGFFLIPFVEDDDGDDARDEQNAAAEIEMKEIPINSVAPATIDTDEIHEESSSEMGLWQTIRTPTYILFVISNFAYPLNTSVFYVHCINLASTMSPENVSLWIVSSIGLIDCLGRIVAGVLLNRVCTSVKPMTLWTVGFCCCSFAVALSPLIDRYLHPLVASGLFGFSFGFQISMVVLVVVTLFESNHLSIVYGGVACSTALGSLLGASTAAECFEWLKTEFSISNNQTSNDSAISTSTQNSSTDWSTEELAYMVTFGAYGSTTLLICLATMIPIIVMYNKSKNRKLFAL